MLVTYALEQRSTWFILAFSGACALGSAYGFLQGAWPFGLVEAIWCGVAARRWWMTGGGRLSLSPLNVSQPVFTITMPQEGKLRTRFVTRSRDSN